VLKRGRGFSLIELMVAVTLLSLLLMLGLPQMSITLQNFRVRTVAESIVSGLQTARTEAVRRNANVRFQLVDLLTAECNLAPAGPHWVVSRNDPTGQCDKTEVEAFTEPNELAQPQILMKRSAGEGGTSRVAIAATSGGAAAGSVIFTPLGRVATGAVDAIEITNPEGGTCEHAGGDIRCLRIIVGRGGQVKMCDPKVADATDPRACP
jgi:type IV fimbrial biogenesis protein FimT